jgi:hypothetical protein
MYITSVNPFLQLIGISAIIGGGVSALINYLMTMRALKIKNRAALIKNKLDMYSFMIFYLDRMIFTVDALKNVNKENSKEEIYGYPANENINELLNILRKNYKINLIN